MILVYEVCISFVSLHSDSIVINITWWYVAYVLKAYIHIHSKTQLCLSKETISIIHTHIYMNNLFLCLVCYFCTFLFKHVWRKRIKKISSSLPENCGFWRGRRGTQILPWPSGQPCAIFFSEALYIFPLRVLLLKQCPSMQVCPETVGTCSFKNLSCFIMPYRYYKVFWTNVRGQLKHHLSLMKHSIIFSRMIEVIF